MEQYINRTIEKHIRKMQGNYPIILLSGTKQAGKSMVIDYIRKCTYEHINYVTFDNIKDRTMAKDNPELFVKNYNTPLIIDEFQFVPEILQYLNAKIEEAKRNEFFGNKKATGTMYYLISSQTIKETREISEVLSSRIGKLYLYSLSTREREEKREDYFLPKIDLLMNKEKSKITKNNIYERILKGGYPAIYSIDEDLERYYSIYINTFIDRNINNIINIKDHIKFMKFIEAVAKRTGKEYNATDIAKEVGITNKTSDEWIGVLKNTFLVYLLQPYKYNAIGRVVKRPKIYFMDTGLACFLSGYSDREKLEQSDFADAIFETYFITEIIKSYVSNAIDPTSRLFYYRDNNHKSVDLIIVEQNDIYPIQIKRDSMEIVEEDVKNLKIKDKLGRQIANGVILCPINQIYQIDDVNYLVPIEYV